MQKNILLEIKDGEGLKLEWKAEQKSTAYLDKVIGVQCQKWIHLGQLFHKKKLVKNNVVVNKKFSFGPSVLSESI